MIRSDARKQAAMYITLGQLDRRLDKDLIELEDWQKTWMSPFAPSFYSSRSVTQFIAQKSARMSRKPIIEITDEDSRTGYLISTENAAFKQSARLSRSLQIGCSEMCIEDMQPGS